MPAQMVAGAGTVQVVAEGLPGQLSLNDAGGVAISDKGKIALPVRFTGDRVDTLILLKPVSPQ